MTKENIEILFTSKISGDSILELKDWKILIYYFRGSSKISVYNGKTFQKLYKIDLLNIIGKYLKQGKDKPEKIDYYLYDLYSPKENISIKQVDEGLILIGFNKYLLEIKLNDKNYEGKVITKNDNTILNINELSDKRIMVITNKEIKIFIKENNEYIVKMSYPLKENWKLKPTPKTYCDDYYDFYQYFSSCVLPNNKLLLNSFSTEYQSFIQCATHPGREFFNSKIIFIDLNNFEEIISNEFFNENPKFIITENYIYIQAYKSLLLYNVNTLELVKNIKLVDFSAELYEYDEQNLIYFLDKYFTIIRIGINKLYKYKVIKADFSFKRDPLCESNEIIGPHREILLTLKNKKIIVMWYNKIYVLKINFY